MPSSSFKKRLIADGLTLHSKLAPWWENLCFSIENAPLRFEVRWNNDRENSAFWGQAKAHSLPSPIFMRWIDINFCEKWYLWPEGHMHSQGQTKIKSLGSWPWGVRHTTAKGYTLCFCDLLLIRISHNFGFEFEGFYSLLRLCAYQNWSSFPERGM